MGGSLAATAAHVCSPFRSWGLSFGGLDVGPMSTCNSGEPLGTGASKSVTPRDEYDESMCLL